MDKKEVLEMLKEYLELKKELNKIYEKKNRLEAEIPDDIKTIDDLFKRRDIIKEQKKLIEKISLIRDQIDEIVEDISREFYIDKSRVLHIVHEILKTNEPGTVYIDKSSIT